MAVGVRRLRLCPIRTTNMVTQMLSGGKRTRFSRRFINYITILLICGSVTLTFIVFFKTSHLAPASSSISGGYADNQQGSRQKGFVAGLLFGQGHNDRKLSDNDPFEKEFGGKDRLPPSVETMEEKPTSHTGDILLNYFLTMYADGLEISWASGVNDRDTLMERMKDFMIMMVEADVHTIETIDNQKTKTPVIFSNEHKKRTDVSNTITMLDWMTKVSKYSNKGIKLNFGDDETLQIAMPLLNSIYDMLHAPLWIHADVVAGPNEPEVQVDVDNLLAMVKNFPKVTLSLGWNTNWDPDVTQLRYGWHDVINMAKSCAPVQQHVSFAIRAVFAVRSMRQLKWLLSLASRFTITVWSQKYDILPIPELVYFRKFMDPKRVYYDLPPNFIQELKDVEAQPEDLFIDGIRITKWNRKLWQPILLQSTSLAFMGADQLVLDGPGSWLISKKPYQPELQRTRTTVVAGKIQFLTPISLKDSNPTRFQIYVRSSGVNPPAENTVQGVRLMIADNGELSLSAQNLKRAHSFSMQSTAKLPKSECYTFRLVDKGEGFPVYSEVRTATCEPVEEGKFEPTSVELHLRVPYETDMQLFYISLVAEGGNDPIILEDLVVS